MPKRIDKLTSEQEARMAEWRDRWIAIGLSTQRADRPRFEAAVAECYRATKLEPPKRVVWTTSPLAMALAAPLAAGILARLPTFGRKSRRGAVRDAVGGAVDDAVRGAVRGAVRDAVRGAVGGAVGGAVDGAVGGAVRDAVGGAVGDAVRDAVGGAVRGAVGGAVGGAVDDAVRGAVGGAVGDAVRGAVGGYKDLLANLWDRYIGGQFWVGGWYYGAAYQTFFREVCGLELSPDIERAARAYAEQCQAACWWWPHRDFVIACERPLHIRRDDRGRLHCETGTAIEWPDGWGLYMWHGTRVPAEWIRQKEKVDPSMALTWRNVEQRRALAEIIGWKRVLEHLQPRVVDQDEDPEIGTLLSADLPDAPDSRFLRVRCGTGRDFVLPVPREMASALQANAWTYGLEPHEYRPEVRT